MAAYNTCTHPNYKMAGAGTLEERGGGRNEEIREVTG